MHKGRSASMQRGAAIRDDQKLPKEEYQAQTRISMSKAELGHFECGATSKSDVLDALRPHIKIMARNGFRKPRDVARLLNKQGIKTASGAPWSPRLAWFLLNFLFDENAKTTNKGLKRQPENQKPIRLAPAAPSAISMGIQEKVATPVKIESRDDLIGIMSQKFNLNSKRRI